VVWLEEIPRRPDFGDRETVWRVHFIFSKHWPVDDLVDLLKKYALKLGLILELERAEHDDLGSI
jgi:hypothetical protein